MREFDDMYDEHCEFSYQTAYEMANLDEGHSMHCSWAAGGDCTCGKHAPDDDLAAQGWTVHLYMEAAAYYERSLIDDYWDSSYIPGPPSLDDIPF